MMKRILLAFTVLAWLSAPALAQKTAPPEIRSNGDIWLGGAGKLGKRRPDGKIDITPESLQIGGPGSTGPAGDFSVQREALANALSLRQKLGETLSVAEYAVGNVLSGDACARISARSKAEGRSIHFPGGSWTLRCTLEIDRSEQSGFNPAALRAAIVGQGQGTTVVVYEGTGTAFRLKGGATGSGHEARQAISGLTLIGPSNTTDGSIGLDLDHIAWLALTDVHITNFDKAINGIDVEYLRAFQAIVRFNKRGVTMNSRHNNSEFTGDANSSDPNSHSWIASTIGNNLEYGADYKRGNSLSFIGSDIQYNGNDAPNGANAAAARPGFGVRNTDSGTQGGVGLLIQGGYVEGNGGVADVWLRQKDPQFVNTSAAIYRIDATGFTRADAARRSTQFVALDFINASGPQSVSINAAFKNFNGATGNGPAVAFLGEKKRADVELDMAGSVYTPGEEVDEFAPYTSTVTRPSATSGFSGSVEARFARRWKTMRVEGQVSVTTAGTGGSGTLNIALPRAVRTGKIASCTASDLNSAAPLYAAATASTLIVNYGLQDNRSIAFSCQYTID